MEIFKLHPLLAKGHCISAQEPSGSSAAIWRPRANIGCNINIAML